MPPGTVAVVRELQVAPKRGLETGPA